LGRVLASKRDVGGAGVPMVGISNAEREGFW